MEVAMGELVLAKQSVVKLRPSSANLYAKCVAAAHGEGDQFLINWEGNAAAVGSALHMAARALVLRQEIPHGEILRKFALNKSQQRDLRMLTACVRKYCDEQLSGGGWSSHIVAEQRLEGAYPTEKANYNLGGTVDFGGFSKDGTIWGIGDWKSTRLENADYSPQQMIYLWLFKCWIQANLPPKKWPRFYQYHIVFVRDWTEEVSEVYTAEQLDGWLVDFLGRIESWNGREYHPGGHCLFCPRQADCPAVYSLVTRMAMALKDNRFEATAERASDDDLVEFYLHGNTVANLIGNAKELLKAIVVGRGGEIAAPHGILATGYRPTWSIDPIKAWPLCEQVLTEQELADATRLSKTALLDAIAHHAAKGQKSKAKEAFWESLEDADAVERQDSVVLSLKKAKTLQTNFDD